jgi:phosphohistidine phosphatase
LKSLLLIRHAKSDWGDLTLKDFDRPLNDRGKRDAPVMAHRLLDKKIKIDAFISSPAKRARKTAELFASQYKQDKKDIIFFDKLYLADTEAFFDIISQTDDDYSSIAVFSHNEGITQFANQLSDVRVDDMPTCSIFAVKMELKKWKDFREAEKEFWFFDYPKSNQL